MSDPPTTTALTFDMKYLALRDPPAVKLSTGDNYDQWRRQICNKIFGADLGRFVPTDITGDTLEQMRFSTTASQAHDTTPCGPQESDKSKGEMMMTFEYLNHTIAPGSKYMRGFNGIDSDPWNLLKHIANVRKGEEKQPHRIFCDLQNATPAQYNNCFTTYLESMINMQAQLIGTTFAMPDLLIVTKVVSHLSNDMPWITAQFTSMDEQSLTIVWARQMIRAYNEGKDRSLKPNALAVAPHTGGEKAGHQYTHKDRKKPNRQGKTFNGKCNHCGIKGHKEADCRKKKRAQQQASMAAQGGATAGIIVMASEPNNSQNAKFWMLDSGASYHITWDRSAFTHMQPCDGTFTVANGGSVRIKGVGTVKLTTQIDGIHVERTLDHVRYVPDCPFQLLAEHQMVLDGYSVEKSTNRTWCIRTSDGSVFLEGHIANARSNPYGVVAMTNAGVALASVDLKTMHQRLGHCHVDAIKAAVKSGHIHGITLTNLTFPDCEDCVAAKLTAQPQPSTPAKEWRNVGDCVSMDMFGPMEESLGGSKYGLLLIDHHSRYTRFWPLKTKEAPAVADAIAEFHVLLHGRNRLGIRMLRSDNAAEFRSAIVARKCRALNIKQQYTAPYSPAQNGMSERRNRTLKEAIRVLLHAAKLDGSYWGEAANAAIYTQNRTPTRSLNGKTPYAMLFGAPPHVGHLRNFGQLCYMLDLRSPKPTQARGIACRFLGYSEDSPAYKVETLAAGDIYWSRNVRFLENFPPTRRTTMSSGRDEDTDTPALHPWPIPYTVQYAPSPHSMEAPQTEADGAAELTAEVSDSDTSFESATPSLPDGSPEPPIRTLPARPGRVAAQQKMTTMIRDGTALVLAAYEDTDSPSLREATKSPEAPQWRTAIQKELDALELNKTWDLVERPPGVKLLGSRFVLTRKRDADGKIQRYKARLVAQGHLQRPGLDYEETFAPVCRWQTVRILLALAVDNDWSIRQIDFDNAYLNAELTEMIYVAPPAALNIPQYDGKVFLLKKALYGLKQAGHQWFATISAALKAHGWKQSQKDAGLWIKQQSTNRCYLTLYVDDAMVTGTSPSLVNDAVQELLSLFKGKNLGKLSNFLGVRFTWHYGRLEMDQSALIAKLTQRFKINPRGRYDNPISTPKNTASDADGPADQRRFREILGSALYIARCTRPDITAAVAILAQFASNPNNLHMFKAEQILIYLHATNDLKLCFIKGPSTLNAYSDSDYASASLDGKSMSGYAIFIGRCLVSWNTKKQSVTAQSTAEAEYLAMGETIREALYIQHVLVELGLKLNIRLHCDNQSAVQIAKDPRRAPRAKHISQRHHLLMDLLTEGSVQLFHLPGTTNTADVFTKGLPTPEFLKHRQSLGLSVC